MLYKKNSKYLLIILFSFFITACISSSGSKEKLTDEQEALLYLRMGTRYLEIGMLALAKENLEIAEGIDRDNVKIQNSLAAMNEQLKEYDEAKFHYQKAVELDGSDFSVKNNFGHFLCERGDYKAGVSLLTQALKLPLNNRKWFAYTNIGLCELRAGDREKAEYNFRSALQINKIYAPALLEMQKISYYSDKYMSARAFLQRYLSVASHTPETLWFAVQTEQQLGNEKAAKGYEDQLLGVFPLSKQARQLKLKAQ